MDMLYLSRGRHLHNMFLDVHVNILQVMLRVLYTSVWGVYDKALQNKVCLQLVAA